MNQGSNELNIVAHNETLDPGPHQITLGFTASAAEAMCNLTDVALVTQSVTPASGGVYATATNSILEFIGTEASGLKYTWRAEISGAELDIPTGTVTKTLVDTTAPTVSISGVPSVTDGSTAFTATFTFNEAVTDFDDVGDVTATNATVGAIAATS
ncbi:MAG: hypothetical protein GY742_07010, partial [Hyphomicrobiales bacterium]|nr:hypothetical protein [Hyphomicrobiales bacterium]